MAGLIDVSKLTFGKSYCMSGGVQLHEIKDCPKDETCAVWASFNRKLVKVRAMARLLESNETDMMTREQHAELAERLYEIATARS